MHVQVLGKTWYNLLVFPSEVMERKFKCKHKGFCRMKGHNGKEKLPRRRGEESYPRCASSLHVRSHQRYMDGNVSCLETILITNDSFGFSLFHIINRTLLKYCLH